MFFAPREALVTGVHGGFPSYKCGLPPLISRSYWPLWYVLGEPFGNCFPPDGSDDTGCHTRGTTLFL